MRPTGFTNSVPDAQRKKPEFVFDFLGRRVQKVVSAWDGSAFSGPNTNRSLYDGWNLLTNPLLVCHRFQQPLDRRFAHLRRIPAEYRQASRRRLVGLADDGRCLRAFAGEEQPVRCV
jgi:hypothetical protein